MGNLNSKEYQNTLQRIERMADGIGRHKNEDKFPNMLNEDEHRQLREDLEAARSGYEEKRIAAELAYDRYKEILTKVADQLSRDDDTLRGYYGKDNPVVADFGTNIVNRSNAGRKSKAPAGAKG